jgi:YfiH family protein
VTIRRVLTTRAGGHSAGPYRAFNLGAGVGDDPVAVTANRARLADGIGVPRDRFVWMDQVHGAEVARVDGPQPRSVAATDGLVTTTPGLALVVLVADCVPILLADEAAGVAAAVHAGRGGAAAGIGQRAVAAMVEAGARPESIEALLGPAICGRCYEVPPQMQADVEAKLPGSACTTAAGTTGLDLPAGLTEALLSVGVGRVVADPRCTAEDDQLYSYRRDGVTGRQAGVAWIDQQ